MKTIASGAKAVGAVPQLGHIAIRTAKPKESIQFYENVFGLTISDQHEDPDARFSIFFLGAQPPFHAIELVWNWDEGEIPTGRQVSHIAFEIEDLHATARAALENHGTMLEEAHAKGEGHWRCYVCDPNGLAIELNEVKDCLPA
ncbi:MAG: VOC family protein [Pseudomonadota bacterium]|nr:VOC family protein [Pseudomonadota bacterium]